MRSLSASELLDAWEAGSVQTSLEPALALLSAASPETSPDDLARLSIGRRDAALLDLREMTFGPQLLSLSACAACGERLELAFNVSDIRVVSDITTSSEEAEASSLDVGRYRIVFRLPNSLDLAALPQSEDFEQSRRRLFDRCIIEVTSKGDLRRSDALPAETVDAVAKRMAELDPQADVRLSLSCPACDHRWQAPFDIASFFWSEVEAWAHRMLRDVHVLASAYGWRESEILSMSAQRRQLYLEMVGR